MTDASDKESSGTFLRISNLPSILTEGIVIVLSILLAFAIDAYWDERKEQVSELRLIKQIEKELTLYQKLLNQADARMEANFKHIDRLLEVIHGQTDIEPTEAEAAIAYIQRRYLLADATATFSSLISDESFGLLSDENLKNALSNIIAFISLVNQFELEETEFINNDYAPFIRQYIDRYSIKSDGIWLKDTSTSRFSSDLEPLFASREFSNLLVERKTKGMLVHMFREQIRKSINEALETLKVPE